MKKPKFELICNGDGGNCLYFEIKNVSHSFASKIRLESFNLMYLDGRMETLCPKVRHMPSSLASGEMMKFECDHRDLKRRPGLAKEIKLIFTAEDEESNVFRCTASKTVDNPQDSCYTLGEWDTNTECISRAITEEREDTYMINNINIGGNAKNVQIQQGNDHSSQVMNENVDYVETEKVLDEIMKYRSFFETEFGEKTDEIVNAITEAKKAIEARDVGKLKSAWNWIKNVASSATGGVISAGVLKLLSQANFCL